MNRVLARQLRRLGLSPTEPPADADTWTEFLARVEATYVDADRSRYLLERSMEISTREMHDLAEEIKELSRQEVARKDQVSQHNFNELPVAAWLEDFRLVTARLRELRRSGVTHLGDYLAEHEDELRDLVSRVIVLDVNPAVSELVGADRADLLGRVDAASLGPESLRSWQPQFEAIWDGVGRVEVEFKGQRVDGSEFAAYLQWAVPEIEGVFDYSRVMVVVIDISDRIAAEERMRELVKAKDEFLASVSHELRTPLTSVVGYAEVLRSVADGPADQMEMIGTIASQAADLANIVEDLLVGARVELGQLEVEAVPIQICEVIRSVVDSHPTAERDECDTPVWALGDAARLRQILRNLLTNAERYGGPDVAIAVERRDDIVAIDVSDDGMPLDDDVVERIFDRYYREGHQTGRPGSVGIGLTISRDLARLMGGDLMYRHDGRLAHFELTLPAVAAAELAPVARKAS